MLKGTIAKLIYNHHDDVDGWQLHDGTLVHFPPHIGKELGEWISEGDKVALEGERHENRNGEEILFAKYVESQGWSLSFEQKVPDHRNQSVKHNSPKHSSVSNEDIMRELFAIRQLIEAWSE
jgi:hypothetical protein